MARCAEEALAIQVTDRNPADVQQVRTYAATYLAYNLIFASNHSLLLLRLKCIKLSLCLGYCMCMCSNVFLINWLV